MQDIMRFTLRSLRLPAFWSLTLLSTLGMNGMAIAQGTSSTNPSGGASTNVQRQQLTRLQNNANSEINRRLTPLNDIADDLDHTGNLPSAVLDSIKTEVKNQIDMLVASRDAITAENSLPNAQAEVAKVNDEYPLYLLAARKGYLVVTTDFQTGLEAKLATVASKLQVRLTAANNVGKDVSSLQITLNDLNSHLQTGKQQTQLVATEVPPIDPGTYETNTSVMKSYEAKLQLGHKEITSAYSDANQITNAIASQNL